MIVWQKADENSEEIHMLIESARELSGREIKELIIDVVCFGATFLVIYASFWAYQDISDLSLWLFNASLGP